jgi:predicted amidohydrolase
MSEFLALGASVPQVVAMTTINPAQVLSETNRRGSLRAGMSADVALFELRAGNWNFVYHPDGPVLKGKKLFIPNLTIKRGNVIEPSARAKNYAQWHASVHPLLAGKEIIEQ